MAEHQLNDFKSNIESDGTVKFSFTLEDKGPAVAWPEGGKPACSAIAKIGPFGQLLIEGVIFETKDTAVDGDALTLPPDVVPPPDHLGSAT